MRECTKYSDYQVVASQLYVIKGEVNLFEFVSKIKKLIKEGWEPIGSLSTTNQTLRNDSDPIFVSQPMGLVSRCTNLETKNMKEIFQFTLCIDGKCEIIKDIGNEKYFLNELSSGEDVIIGIKDGHEKSRFLCKFVPAIIFKGEQ
jgi:hypothetical protein